MTNLIINRDGTKYWYNSNKQLHRDDGPAIEWADGSKFWCINGEYHRDDGPAYEGGDGDGRKEWFIRDVDITDKVNQWIIDNNFPKYKEWDDSIKVLFKLKFG